MSGYFPEPFQYSGGNVKLKLDPSNYVTKNDFKGVYIYLESKRKLAFVKAKVVNNLNVNNLNNIHDDSNNLSNLVIYKVFLYKKIL